MSRILLVDDDRFVLRSLEKLLVAEGYICRTATNGADALHLLQKEAFNMVILDVGLPDTDGFTLCRKLRTNFKMPVIYLSARADYADKVVGLELGGADYLTKPFEPRELVARMRSHMRRAEEYNKEETDLQQIHLGNILIDAGQRDAYKVGEALNLTEKEFALLFLLAQHPERAVATNRIFEEVWGFNSESGSKTVAVTIRRLRCKLENDPDNPALLITVRGFGYRLTSGIASSHT